MFELTPEETAATRRLTEIDRELRSLHAPRLRSGGFGGPTPEDEARHETETAAYRAKMADLESEGATLARLAERAELKSELGRFARSWVPGSPAAILDVVEEALVPGETTDRFVALGKSVFVRACALAADPEINKARATVVAARYQALIEAGLPEGLVAQILVAEASRPWPTAGTSVRKS